MPARLKKPAVLTIAVVVVFLIAARVVFRYRSSASSKRNVVVILIDTLRADYLQSYGFELPTAPFIDFLAKDSLVFDRAFSASSWTAPATASIFTSLYPSQHGVITGFMAAKRLKTKRPEMVLNRLPEGVMLLPEYLKSAGYETIAVADNINIGPEIGFNRGFDKFHQFRNQGSATVAAQAMEFLDKRDTAKPYFLYLHFMDPHGPYVKHEPMFSTCMEKLGASKKNRVRCRYASEITVVDQAIGALVEKYGWKEDTLLFITSDHGEEFWEHGDRGHGQSVYRELINIPLLLRYPGCSIGRIHSHVSSMDILPTIAEAAGLPVDENWQGQSLLKFCAQSEEPGEPRSIYSERLQFDEKTYPSFRSLVSENRHFISTDRSPARGDEELFDLSTDWQEKHNLASSENELRQSFVESLNSRFSFDRTEEAGQSHTVEMDAETMKQLKSLGYLQ